MTLIVGLRGINKSFLVADSRATNTTTNDYRDDISKWVNYGRNAVSVAAGDGHLAVYLSNKILSVLNPEAEYPEVRSVFDEQLEEYARQFNIETNRFASCTIMLAGYSSNEDDDFDAGRLGEILGAGVKKHGEGVTVNQNIDKEIIKSMSYSMTIAEILGKQLRKGSVVKVLRPKSELIAFDIRVQADGVHIDLVEAGNFEGLIFGMDTRTNKLVLPDETIAEIYFRDLNNANPQAILEADGIHLIRFIREVTEQRQYTGVGGNIVPIALLNGQSILLGGQVSKMNLTTREVTVVNDLQVINNKLHYMDTDGEWKPYKTFEEMGTGNFTEQYSQF